MRSTAALAQSDNLSAPVEQNTHGALVFSAPMPFSSDNHRYSSSRALNFSLSSSNTAWHLALRRNKEVSRITDTASVDNCGSNDQACGLTSKSRQHQCIRMHKPRPHSGKMCRARTATKHAYLTASSPSAGSSNFWLVILYNKSPSRCLMTL